MSARNLLSILLLATLAAPGLPAAEVKIFRTDSREAFLAGTLEGVSIDELGALRLAARLEPVAKIEEPFLFAAAALPGGWALATGNAGKVLEVADDGTVRELCTLEEPEVFALAAAQGGGVLAASSPGGKVYRCAEGKSEVVLDPEEAYVWDLATTAKGEVLVATGLDGGLYRVDPRGRAEKLASTGDAHARTLLARADGSVVVGTAGRGLVLAVSADGKVTTLFDAVQPEIVDLASGPDGALYFAAVASEASWVDLSQSTAASDSADGGEQPTVAVQVQELQTVGSRPAGAAGPRSLIYRLGAEGVEEIASFQDETVHSLLWHAGALWIGTGQEGRLWRFTGGQLMLEHKLAELQIAALVARGEQAGSEQAAVVTANGSALYRLAGEPAAMGTYTSAVLDAGEVARFGSFAWWGEPAGQEGVEIAFRSGLAAKPDATWTPWTAAAKGHELGLAALPEGRYVQWRATLRAVKGAAPRLGLAELSYAQRNLRPQVESFEVLDPGEILVPTAFNPQNQTFEPWSPNRQGIFTSLSTQSTKDEGSLQTLWKGGYRTLRWKVEDPNGDPLLYALEVRRDSDPEGWMPVVAELDQVYYSFDETVLPDGLYRFRLKVSDGKNRLASEGLGAEETTPAVAVDHTPPELVTRKRRGNLVEVSVRDRWSPLRQAMVSIDAGEWQPAPAVDGLVDGRAETLRVEIPQDARVVLLRLMDAALNVLTYDLLDGEK